MTHQAVEFGFGKVGGPGKVGSQGHVDGGHSKFVKAVIGKDILSLAVRGSVYWVWVVNCWCVYYVSRVIGPDKIFGESRPEVAMGLISFLLSVGKITPVCV